MKWRLGRKSGHNIYLQTGEQPSDADRQIGVMFDPKHAAQAVMAVNGPGVPAADYGSAWTELRGYVAQALADGGLINPVDLLPYMDELRHRALAPVRDWMSKLETPDA